MVIVAMDNNYVAAIDMRTCVGHQSFSKTHLAHSLRVHKVGCRIGNRWAAGNLWINFASEACISARHSRFTPINTNPAISGRKTIFTSLNIPLEQL